MPSVVVTRQYSPSLSPLVAPVSLSTFVPSSLLRCHRFGMVPSWISSPPCPGIESVALSPPQHRSPTPVCPSSLHALYVRAIAPTPSSKPSPTQDGWLFDAAVRPSRLPDEYAKPSCGAGPPRPGGVR